MVRNEREQFPRDPEYAPANGPFSVATIDGGRLKVSRPSQAGKLFDTIDKVVFPSIARTGTQYCISGGSAVALYGLAHGNTDIRPINDIDVLAHEEDDLGEHQTLRGVVAAYTKRVGEKGNATIKETSRVTPGGLIFRNRGVDLRGEGEDFFPVDILSKQRTILPDALIKPEVHDLVQVSLTLPLMNEGFFAWDNRRKVEVHGMQFNLGQLGVQTYIYLLSPFWLRAIKLVMGREQDKKDIETLRDLGLIKHTDTFMPQDDEIRTVEERKEAKYFDKRNPLKCTTTSSYDALQNDLDPELREKIVKAVRRREAIPDLLAL